MQKKTETRGRQQKVDDNGEHYTEALSTKVTTTTNNRFSDLCHIERRTKADQLRLLVENFIDSKTGAK